MNATAQAIDNLTLNVTQEIHVHASLDATFAALLEEIGPHNAMADGKPMPMKIEPWPGGRWYRDLGVTITAIFGDMCKPSSGRRCLKSPGRCSCPIR